MIALAAILACAPPPAPPPADEALFHTVTTDEPPMGPAAAGPSVVLVIGCTVRADQTSLDGGPATTTPFLASLAASGVTFDDPVTAAPWTRPAATALLTGSHALTVGMTDPAPTRDERVLPDGVVTLAEHLRAHGYTTVGVSTNPNVHSRYGLHQGFAVWREPASPWTDRGVKIPGTVAASQVEGLLADVPVGRPVFLLVVLVDAHSPHDATDAERVAQADPTVPAAVVDYRAVLRRWDDAVHAIVDVSRARLGERTLVAVVSDHGDGLSFPAHHGRSHGRYLAPSVVRGVWVMAGGGLPAGVRVGGTVSQIDVAPTLAVLAGAGELPGEGRDRAAEARAGGRVPPAPAFADTWFQEVDRAAVYTTERACQMDFSGRPPADGFVDACFDRRTDPRHEHPLRDEALEAVLLRFRAEREGVSPAPEAAPDPALDAQLRALGYR